MQEGYAVQQGLPHGQVTDLQLVLRDAYKGALQAGTHALGRVVGELDGGLQQKRSTSVAIFFLFL